MAREKKTRRTTEGRGETKRIHKKKLIIKEIPAVSSSEEPQRKEQYRISLLAPIIGVCVKDIHCTVLFSSRYLRIDLSPSVFLCLCLYRFTA